MVAPPGVPAVNADQTVIILWDQQRQIEHLIRKANFRSAGESVGFLVPTPTRPQLEESGNEAFPFLAEITAPKPPATYGIAVVSAGAEGQGVRVIEEKTVAGFHTVVLTAGSGKALTKWLQQHGYAYTSETAAWAQPYLEGGWFMTAMKIAKPGARHSDPRLAASALRISFKTDHPLFPYREPDSKKAADQLSVSNRLLQIYLVAESRYEGRFSSGRAWDGKAEWSWPLRSDQRSQLLKFLALPESTGPAQFWLTEFVDHWPYGKAPGDLYFATTSFQMKLGKNPGPG